MKRFIPIILALSILLSGCGNLGTASTAEMTPTMSVEDIRATADALVYDMLTQTAIAMPTNTPIPPTETPLPPTATATATLVPTVVEDTAAVTEAAPTAEIIPTNTTAPTTSSSTFPCTEKPLSAWGGQSVSMRITNNVPNTTANLFLCITTTEGDAGYIAAPAGSTIQVPYGYFTATAWVSGDKNFNSTIGFEIKTPDALQIVIENGRVYLRAGCYPGC